MRFSSLLSLKKIPILKWGRSGGKCSAVTLGNVKRRTSVNCCQGSYIARQLVWRIRSQWKPAQRWQKGTIRCNYDAHSYAQNFDDGFFNDNPSPLAPK